MKGTELQGRKAAKRRCWCSYPGARLHGVAQITAEVTGLVLGLVAAGQLGPALRNKRRDWSNHSKRQPPRKRPTTVILFRVVYWLLEVVGSHCVLHF